jgi:glycyl-tRNA synthetase alpha subunit
MGALHLFKKGDVYLDYEFEDRKYRFEKASNKVFVRCYGKQEVEIDHGNERFNEAISSAKVITKEQYFSDATSP